MPGLLGRVVSPSWYFSRRALLNFRPGQNIAVTLAVSDAVDPISSLVTCPSDIDYGSMGRIWVSRPAVLAILLAAAAGCQSSTSLEIEAGAADSAGVDVAPGFGACDPYASSSMPTISAPSIPTVTTLIFFAASWWGRRRLVGMPTLGSPIVARRENSPTFLSAPRPSTSLCSSAGSVTNDPAGSTRNAVRL